MAKAETAKFTHLFVKANTCRGSLSLVLFLPVHRLR